MKVPLTVEDALAGLPTTYRQVDHWIRKGWVKGDAPGSGVKRHIAREELRVLQAMARLVDAGLMANSAAVIARTAVENGASIIHVTDYVSVVLGEVK